MDRIEILREGQEVAFLKPGDPATFRIHYRADVDIVSAVFGLGFVHESGVFTAGPNSESGGSWTLPSGTGYVDFEVESVILQPGAYSVTSAIVDGAHTYDYVERHADVLVRATDQVEPGLVRMPGTWSVTPSAVANRAAVSGHE